MDTFSPVYSPSELPPLSISASLVSVTFDSARTGRLCAAVEFSVMLKSEVCDECLPVCGPVRLRFLLCRQSSIDAHQQQPAKM